MADSNNSESCIRPKDQGPPSKRMKVDDDSDLENKVYRLPYDVLFDYFSAKDRAIAAAVSKHWNKILSPYPVFHANYFSFEKKSISAENLPYPTYLVRVPEWTRNFLKIMDESLIKFSEQHAAGRWNAFVVTMRNTSVLVDRNSDYLDRWINFVVDKKFTDLHLNIELSSHHRYYVPPKAILNARSLVALSLSSCKLPNIGDDVVICLDSLQQLNLVKCFCEQRSIGNLISACHALRELSIIECSDFTELNLHLYKLKKLMVRENVRQGKSIRKIIVRATCLVSFSYVSSTWVDNKPCQINLEACKQLESLCLGCLVFPKGFLPDICENFPLLRSLILSPAQGLKTVFVRSKTLESFSFGHPDYEFLGHSKLDAVEVVMRTPNLKFFNYTGRPSLKQLSAFSKFSPHVWIKKTKLYTETTEMDARWFLSLGDAICQLGSNLTLSLVLRLLVSQDRWSFSIEELGNDRFRRLANVEHLELKAYFLSNDLCLLSNRSLMAGLLWSCHPKTLSLSVPSDSHIERLRQDLLNQIIEERTCDPDIFRCWPHDLKDVMVEYVVDPKKEVHRSRKIKFSFIWY